MHRISHNLPRRATATSNLDATKWREGRRIGGSIVLKQRLCVTRQTMVVVAAVIFTTGADLDENESVNVNVIILRAIVNACNYKLPNPRYRDLVALDISGNTRTHVAH